MEWVKLHLSWADGLEAMTDGDGFADEAACGRFILGLMHYIKTGEKPELYGPEKVLFAMAVSDLKKDYAFIEKTNAEAEAKRQAISEARSAAANARWGKAPDASSCKSEQMDADASTSTQEQSTGVQVMPKNKDIRSKNKEDRDKENKKKDAQHANARRAKDVTEARYDQRPNEEPDGTGMPLWLADKMAEITGYSDPAGNQEAPDRPDIHMEDG